MQVQGPEARLTELNKELVPTIERRGILRSQLENSENKANELEKEIASKLTKFDDSKRSELREQFEAHALSDEHLKSPEIAQIYARYVEATELQRHTSTLREQLAAYERQLTLALAQRNRLQERVDSIKRLGFDPECGVTIDKEKDFYLIQKLAALGNTQNSALTVGDVVSRNDDANDVAARVFTDDTDHAVETLTASIETNDALTKQIGNLQINRQFEPLDRTVEFITNDDGSVTKVESGILGDRAINFLTNIFDEIRDKGWYNGFTIIIFILIVILVVSISSSICRLFRTLSNIALCLLFVLLIISARLFLGVL